MDFVEKEFMFLFFFLLSLGTLGVLVEPYPENVAVLIGTTNVPITCCSSVGADYIYFYYFRVGDTQGLGAKTETLDSKNFIGSPNVAKKSYTLIIRNATTLMAGEYHCDEGPRRYALVTVLSQNPTCSFSPRQTKQLLCNDTITLTCTVSYTANWTYVAPIIKWSTVPSSSEALTGSMETTRSGTVTTATSTLKVTWPVDHPGAIPIYSCSASFGLVDGLPKELQRKPADYDYLCKPFTSPDDVPCTKEEPKEEPKEEKKTSTTEKKKEGPAITIEKNEALTVTAKKNEALTVTAEKNEAPTFTTKETKVSTTDDKGEKQQFGDTDGSSVVSYDTNIVLLSVAGSLLLAQAF